MPDGWLGDPIYSILQVYIEYMGCSNNATGTFGLHGSLI